jgi:hypothetical protein
LSRSNENACSANDNNGEASTGVESEAWYDDFVFVPRLALSSSVSAPPSALRMRAVTFCS